MITSSEFQFMSQTPYEERRLKLETVKIEMHTLRQGQIREELTLAALEAVTEILKIEREKKRINQKV